MRLASAYTSSHVGSKFLVPKHALIVAPCDTRLSSVHDDDRIGTCTCSRHKEASYMPSSYSLNMVNQSFLHNSIQAEILYIKYVMVTPPKIGAVF